MLLMVQAYKFTSVEGCSPNFLIHLRKWKRFRYDGSGVIGPCHLIGDLNSEKSEAVHNHHSFLTDDDRNMAFGIPPEVNNMFFSLAHISGQLIILVPHCQILHLPPVSTLIIVSYQTNHSGIISIFN